MADELVSAVVLRARIISQESSRSEDVEICQSPAIPKKFHIQPSVQKSFFHRALASFIERWLGCTVNVGCRTYSTFIATGLSEVELDQDSGLKKLSTMRSSWFNIFNDEILNHTCSEVERTNAESLLLHVQVS